MTRIAGAWLIASLVGAGCGDGARGPAPLTPAPVALPVSGEPGAFSPSGDRHPGEIVYEDHVEHRTWTRSALDVPATIAWVMVRGRWRPVVLVEIEGAGQQREITTYGPGREFLEHTTARLAAPPPRPSAPPRPAPVAPAKVEPEADTSEAAPATPDLPAGPINPDGASGDPTRPAPPTAPPRS